jgi:hypothetical protein
MAGRTTRVVPPTALVTGSGSYQTVEPEANATRRQAGARKSAPPRHEPSMFARFALRTVDVSWHRVLMEPASAIATVVLDSLPVL